MQCKKRIKEEILISKKSSFLRIAKRIYVTLDANVIMGVNPCIIDRLLGEINFGYE